MMSVRFPRNVIFAGMLLLCNPLLGQFVVRVQPIQLSNGSQSAPIQIGSELAYLQQETDKLWSQAGIDVQFLPLRVYTSSTFYNVVDTLGAPNNYLKLFYIGGHQQNEDPTVLNMFFVNTIGGSGSYAGITDIGGNGVAIASVTFSSSMRDNVAHELGHSLGLTHYTSVTDNSSGVFWPQDNLMAGGSGQGNRSIPTQISQIYDVNTNPTGLGKLTAAQITAAQGSAFVTPVPEPVHGMLLAGALLIAWKLIGVWLRTRRAAA